MSLDVLQQTATATRLMAPNVTGGRIEMAGPFSVGNKPFQNSGLTNLTTAGNETYTAAHLMSRIITRDPNGGGRTDTTDTAANILAAFPALADGDMFEVILINTADAAEAITLAGGTNVTISNVGQTIAQNEAAILIFRRTSSTALTLYIVGA